MKSHRILLIYPPHTRNTEPPLGLGILSGYLAGLRQTVRILDLNCQSGPMLAQMVPDTSDSRRHRSALHIHRAINSLRGVELYKNYARYRTALEYYAEALRGLSQGTSWWITPGDFTSRYLPDFHVSTLRHILQSPEINPFHSLNIDIIESIISEFRPSVIGISVIYRSQFINTLTLAEWISTTHPSMQVILGGSFLRCLPEPAIEFLRTKNWRIVIGPGEWHIGEILGIDALPAKCLQIPDFDTLDRNLYFSSGSVIPVTSTRGCYWSRCTFCDEAQDAFTMDQPEDFSIKLDSLYRRYRPAMFHFTDNAVPPVILHHMARHGSPVPWYGFVRATSEFTRTSWVKSLADSGCRMLQLGFETPVQTLLGRMNKGINADDFPKILSNLHDYGIKSYVYLMFGFPGQDESDWNESIRLIENNPVDFVNASIFRLPRTSQIAILPMDYAIETIPNDSADRLNVEFVSDGYDMRRLRMWLSRCFYRHPIIKSIIAKTPPYYKSNHAVFL